MQCPSVINEYNQSMGGVDRQDQLRQYYALEKCCRTKFWPFKLFLGLLGIVLANAFILWRSFRGAMGTSKRSHAVFIEELMVDLTTKGDKEKRNNRARDAAGGNVEGRLSRDPPHFLCMMELVPNKHGKARGLRCILCSLRNQDSRTRLECDQCHVPLCSAGATGRDCFKEYHTLAQLPKGLRQRGARSPPAARGGRGARGRGGRKRNRNTD